MDGVQDVQINVIEKENRKFTYEIASQDFTSSVLLPNEFDIANAVSYGWGVVGNYESDGYFETYFNPAQGKLCPHKFKDAFLLSGNWGVVQQAAGKTYYNPNLSLLCERTFDSADAVSRDWGKVGKNGRVTYYNPNRNKLCKHNFVEGKSQSNHGLFEVVLEDGRTFFNPEDDYVLSARITRPGKINVEDCLAEHPEDFNHLPTALFEDKIKVESCLNAIKNSLKSAAPRNAQSQREVEEYKDSCDRILVAIFDKITSEKQKIASRKEKNSEIYNIQMNAAKEAVDRKMAQIINLQRGDE